MAGKYTKIQKHTDKVGLALIVEPPYRGSSLPLIVAGAKASKKKACRFCKQKEKPILSPKPFISTLAH